MTFCLSPQDVLDRCYFGVIFRFQRFQRYLRRICAVPSRTVFCSWLGDILSRPIVLKCFLRSLGIAPNDPITTGKSLRYPITVACFSHNLSISIFRSWYLLIFSSSLSSILPSSGIATSIIHTRFFSTIVMSGMLCARCLSLYILKSQRILTSSFCRTLSTLCRGTSAALMQLCRAGLCSRSAQFCYNFSPSGLLSLPLPCKICCR